MAIAFKFWREIAIGLLIVGMIATWNVIQARNDTIHQMDIVLAEYKTQTATDNKWVSATTAVLTQVIDSQNEGIDRVLAGIDKSSTEITSSVNVARAENAVKVAGLKAFISDLPTATDCSTMINNMIRNGEAIQW